MFKTENEIWADVLRFINTALTANAVSGWTVTRSYQPTKGTLKSPYILVQRLNNRTLGFQQSHIREITGNEELLNEENKEIQEITFQIDAIKRRIPGERGELTSSDVLAKLRLWFNSSDGIKTIRADNYNIYPVKRINEPYFETSDDVFEFNPNLELVLITGQTYDSTVSKVYKAEYK